MSAQGLDVVTGAFGYTGRYLTRRLIAEGRTVRTLTNKPPATGEDRTGIEVHPLAFDEPQRLVEALRGASTLYNTYWVRFTHGDVSYERAVDNTRTLFRAARDAGVGRIVHVSITNADESSPLPYFRWKAVLERELRELGTGYAIVRPTVIFGLEDILINNVAWLLRRLPLFLAPGGGEYRLQPVYVDDLAALLAEAGATDGDVAFDAVGPEQYRFIELVEALHRAVGSHARVVTVPPPVALRLSSIVGRLVRDVVLTRDELDGLRGDLLVSSGPPTATTSFREWSNEHGRQLGRTWASELARHYRR
ncbi:MAG TPA: NAD(P)H-binding protein [Gaiellaceae bacterium]|jgi:NADH dehydrogenase